MTDTITVAPNMTATLVVAAGEGPTLVNNPGPNTVFLGDNDAIRVSDAGGIVALNPNGFINVDGKSDLFATIAAGQVQTLNKLTGGLNFFSPPSLSGLGGAKVFVQPAAPTQPPTIPLNSLWFNTTANSIEYWTGAAWTTQAFNAGQLLQVATITASLVQNGTLTTSQLAAAAGILGTQIAANTIAGSNIAANTITAANIAANTITAAQLAAGIIYAGIVDGTLIQGATLRIKNSFGATIMTVNKTAGTWIQYLDTGSSTQGIPVASSVNAQVTDEFGNLILGGLCNYNQISVGNFNAIQIFQGNINFLNSSSLAGPWNIYTSLEPDSVTGLLAYFDNAGNFFALGTKTFRSGTVPINSTTPIVILTQSNIEAITYWVDLVIVYVGGATAANAGIGWDGSATISNCIGVVRRGRGSTNVDNVLPVNSTGPPGLLALAFNVNETCTYEFHGMVTFSATGTFNIRGQEGTAGDSWTVGANSSLNMTPVH